MEETFSGNYVVVFDPLDGSSNIDAGVLTQSMSLCPLWGVSQNPTRPDAFGGLVPQNAQPVFQNISVARPKTPPVTGPLLVVPMSLAPCRSTHCRDLSETAQLQRPLSLSIILRFVMHVAASDDILPPIAAAGGLRFSLGCTVPRIPVCGTTLAPLKNLFKPLRPPRAGISTGSIFGIYDPNDECSLEDMDDPEQMMKNCVLNVCQPGAVLHLFRRLRYPLVRILSILL